MFKNQGAMSQRQAGVRHATEESTDRGEPQKLQGIGAAECLFLEYTDERGIKAQMLVFKVGNQYVTTKDSQTWCKSLHPIADWLKKQVEAKLEEAKPVELPESDSVDVVG